MFLFPISNYFPCLNFATSYEAFVDCHDRRLSTVVPYRKLCYFGKCADDPKGQAALSLWLDQRDDLLAGRVPSTDKDALTLRELINRFLTSKRAKVDSGELAKITWTDYHVSCKRLLEFLGDRRVDGLGPDDFGRFRAKVANTNKGKRFIELPDHARRSSAIETAQLPAIPKQMLLGFDDSSPAD